MRDAERESSGAESSGAESSGAESSGAESSGAESSGAESSGAESSGAEGVSSPRPQTDDIAMDHQQASVGALLSLLESYPPEALAPFLERVEILALNVRGCQKRDASLAFDSVLSDGHLLGLILGYDGSLAMKHVHYGSLVGYEHPLPSPGFGRQYIQGTAGAG